MRRHFALILAAGMFALNACEKVSSPLKPRPSIQNTLNNVLEAAGNPQGEHEQVEAIALWMNDHYKRTSVSPKHDPASLLSASELDPLGATVLFREFLVRLEIQSRIVLYYNVPAYGWYPIVEIVDADGDHAWDPFGARYSPDYDGTPKAFKGMAAGPVKHLGDERTPSFQSLSVYPHTSLRLEAASMFATDVNFTEYVPFEYNEHAPKRGVFRRQFESLGESNSELGPINVGHTFHLQHLVPGSDYFLEAEWNDGTRNNLLLSSLGVTVESKQVLPKGVRYTFKAKTSTGKVSLGAGSNGHFKMTTLKWYRP